jgi:pimeloyl-ACP methyl ester carboxylesterase
MPFLDTPRLRIHYQEAGTGPQVFVLVHGNFASWRWWKPILERLPNGWRALALDLRGCGESSGGELDESGSTYDIPQLADDLAGFADLLRLDTFHLVGHSLGGAVALQYALHHQSRLRSLTLAAPPPATGLVGMRSGASAFGGLLGGMDPNHRPSMAALRSSYRMHRTLGTNRLMLRRALPEMMPAAALDPAVAESLLADAARLSSDTVVGFLQALHRWNVEAELPGLRIPTLILWGAKDIVVPRAGLEQMARLLPLADLVVWPDTGHSPQLERPDRFVASLAVSIRNSRRKRLRRLLRRTLDWCAAAFSLRSIANVHDS